MPAGVPLHYGKRFLKCVRRAGFDRDKRQSQSLGNLPQRRLSAPIARKVGIEQKPDAQEIRNCLLQQLKPLAQNLAAGIIGKPGDVPAGVRQARDKPVLTGSILLAMTIGMVVVAFMAATVVGLNPVRMTSTPSRTSSAATTGNRSVSPLAKPYSITTFSPTR